MAGKVYWNGAEAATLSSMDDDLIAIQLPSVHKGHHSVFVQLECSKACPHPVNGSVFFAASASFQKAASASKSSEARPVAAKGTFSEALGQVRNLSCTPADVQAFLPSHFNTIAFELAGQRERAWAHKYPAEQGKHRRRKAAPSKTEVCAALAALHEELWQAVIQRPLDPDAWMNLARWLVSRGRLHAAIQGYRSALRVLASSQTGEQVHVLEYVAVVCVVVVTLTVTSLR